MCSQETSINECQVETVRRKGKVLNVIMKSEMEIKKINYTVCTIIQE